MRVGILCSRAHDCSRRAEEQDTAANTTEEPPCIKSHTADRSTRKLEVPFNKERISGNLLPINQTAREKSSQTMYLGNKKTHFYSILARCIFPLSMTVFFAWQVGLFTIHQFHRKNLIFAFKLNIFVHPINISVVCPPYFWTKYSNQD